MFAGVYPMSLRFLVRGCGSIGQRHIKNLHSLKAGEILPFDLLKDRREALSTELGLPMVNDLKEAWDWKPNIVVIASDTNSHIPLALQAIEHGCHVFIEKPLSYSLDGIPKLCSEIERRQLVTMVACNLRFHPGPASVKKLLEENLVGRVIAARIQTGSYLPRWRPQQDYRMSYSASPEWGGAILDCIHEIDLALWYFGAAKVLAAFHLPAESIGLKTDGLAEIIMNHESGVLNSLHLNFVQRDYRRAFQIIGSEGTIYWDFGDQQVRVYGADGKLKQTCMEPDRWEINQMYLDELEHFLWAVKSGSQTVNPVSGGVRALEVALTARKMGIEGRA